MALLESSGNAFWVHTAFEWSAIAIGAALYRRAYRRSERTLTISERQRLAILLGAMAGAALGSKLAFLLHNPGATVRLAGGVAALAGGQSIVGGLVGGLLGVEAAKRIAGVNSSTGDAFVVPILVAIIIGRCGCFLTGLYDGTSGTVTTLPWGYDFGDGQLRHPTQVYDQLFAALLLALLHRGRSRLARAPGLQFKLMLSSYLLWRLLIDFLKPKPVAYFGALSGIQLVALIALIAYLPAVIGSVRRLLDAPTDTAAPRIPEGSPP